MSCNSSDFLINPHDNKNYISVLRTPWFSVQDQFLVDVSEAASKSKKDSYWKQSFVMKTDENQKLVLSHLEKYLSSFYNEGLSYCLRNFYQSSGIIEACHKKDPSGRQESNLWKLYAKIQQAEGESAKALLNLIQVLNAENDEEAMDQEVVPLLEPERVHLMTVHASKGLQFSHVILLGVSQDQQKSKNLPWSWDSNGHFCLSLRHPEDQSWVHPILANQLTEEKNKQEQKESYRVLYVALTRAKESVTLILSQKPGKSSWHSLMKWDLSMGRRQTGNYFYDVVESITPNKNSLGNNTTAITDSQWPEKYISKLVEDPKSMSPTGLLDFQLVAQESKKTVNQDQRIKVLKKIQRGISYHRLFESMKYMDLDQIQSSLLSAEDKEVFKFMIENKNVPWLELIREGHAEWGFELQTSVGLLRGQIDLWGRVGKTTWIVDYKTGSMQYQEKAFSQLKIYAESLKAMKKIKPEDVIQLAIIYPFDQKVLVEEFIAPEKAKL